MGTVAKEGKVLTNGGRVFCISSYGVSVYDAVEICREELKKVTFNGMQYRDDIGYEFQ
jgi:phosphoribosylamine--glycine ligase